MTHLLDIYADTELGAYGYHEKPWYLPGARLQAFLGELNACGMTDALRFCRAGRARDEDLQLFHTKAHIESVRRRCGLEQGSLDGAVAPVVDDAHRLLESIRLRSRTGAVKLEDVRGDVGTLVPAMTFDDYFQYLKIEQLLEIGTDGHTVSLTTAGNDFLSNEKRSLSGPTFARSHVERAATWVAGAVVDATRRILRGETQTVFIPIAGFHHAHAEEARLYCLYNDPALAISCALSTLDGNIAYIDIDIHHGDGVYEGFASEPRVIIADLHEDPSTLFPFTPDSPGSGEFWGRRDAEGSGSANGTKLNIPLSPNTTDDEYLAHWDEAEKFLRAANPQFIVFESGVDGLADDPMSNQRITCRAIQEVARRVRAIADELAGGRLLVLGGGGYALDSVAKGWVHVVKGLIAEES
jgi:acetoin utilization protein AcuC